MRGSGGSRADAHLFLNKRSGCSDRGRARFGGYVREGAGGWKGRRGRGGDGADGGYPPLRGWGGSSGAQTKAGALGREGRGAGRAGPGPPRTCCEAGGCGGSDKGRGAAAARAEGPRAGVAAAGGGAAPAGPGAGRGVARPPRGGSVTQAAGRGRHPRPPAPPPARPGSEPGAARDPTLMRARQRRGKMEWGSGRAGRSGRVPRERRKEEVARPLGSLQERPPVRARCRGRLCQRRAAPR